MNEKNSTGKAAAFPGMQTARPPLEQPPVCHFDDWPLDPDGHMDERPPIGTASDGPDSSGKPLEYMRYLVYGFDVELRRLWVEPAELYVPSSGGIDGYVAQNARRMHGVYPFRLFMDLDRFRSAVIHHRAERAPSSLHSSRCDHPVVVRWRPADWHRQHEQCFELQVCNDRAEHLPLGHDDTRCKSFRTVHGDFTGADGKQRALLTSHRYEHARVLDVHRERIILTTTAGVKP
ncbi:hypothetical protein [Streptomyces albogriseolus]|uniref:hypothetical protein n=1 Tax=Streptomyces albogriseolus TaxID=1887 RepID=UPI00345F18D9